MDEMIQGKSDYIESKRINKLLKINKKALFLAYTINLCILKKKYLPLTLTFPSKSQWKYESETWHKPCDRMIEWQKTITDDIK